MHLHCYGLSDDSPSAYNWWGLEFYNATTKSMKHYENVMITETASKVSSIALRRRVDLADVQAKKSFGAQMSYNCHSLEWHTCLFKEKT